MSEVYIKPEAQAVMFAIAEALQIGGFDLDGGLTAIACGVGAILRQQKVEDPNLDVNRTMAVFMVTMGKASLGVIPSAMAGARKQ